MTRIVLALVATAVLAGCSLLSPEPDRSRFFVLSADVGEPRTAPVQRDMVLGVGPVSIPGYLDRNEVVTRVNGDELRYSPLDRWAEPLQSGVTRVMTENLIGLLHDGLVLRFPWSSTAPIDYQVTFDIRRFETSTDGTAELAVRWAVREGRTGRYRAARETVLREQGAGTDTGTGVNGLSRTLLELARIIKDEVDRLGVPDRPERRRTRR